MPPPKKRGPKPKPTFKNVNALLEAEKVEKLETKQVTQCPLCKKVFKDEGYLNVHISNQKDHEKCSICGELVRDVKSHIDSKHREVGLSIF